MHVHKEAKACILAAPPLAKKFRPPLPAGNQGLKQLKGFAMKHLLLLLAFGAGCCLPVQAGINTLLRRFLGEPMPVSYTHLTLPTTPYV